MTPKNPNLDQVARYADMLSAMGTEPRLLRILQLPLSTHPDGMVLGDSGAELDIPNSTLSHHLEKKNEDLMNVPREGTFLWYSANAQALQELLGFLYAECRTRNEAVDPRSIVSIYK